MDAYIAANGPRQSKPGQSQITSAPRRAVQDLSRFKINPNRVGKRQNVEASHESADSLFDTTHMDAAVVQEITGGYSPHIQRSHGKLSVPETPSHGAKDGQFAQYRGAAVSIHQGPQPDSAMQDVLAGLDADFARIAGHEEEASNTSAEEAGDDEEHDESRLPESPQSIPVTSLTPSRLQSLATTQSLPSQGPSAPAQAASMAVRSRQTQPGLASFAFLPQKPSHRQGIQDAQHRFPVKGTGLDQTRNDLNARTTAVNQQDRMNARQGQEEPLMTRNQPDAPFNQSRKRTDRAETVQQQSRSRSVTPNNVRYDDDPIDTQELDRSREQLASIAYKDLEHEPFDSAKTPISDKDKLVDLLTEGQAAANAEEQSELFAQLHVDDWEQAGEWFVDEFSKLLQQMMQARRAKRALVAQYEARVAQRQRAVESREAQIGRALGVMRQGGQGLLRPEREVKTEGDFAEQSSRVEACR